jgi:SAM-dependent methyltransferase
MPRNKATFDDWWASYFDEVYLRIYEPLLPPAETDHEVAAIRELLEERNAKRILDVPCGWGLGWYSVPGVATRRALAAGAAVRLVRSDMRQLPFSGEFDAALCLFSSLGYFVGPPGRETNREPGEDTWGSGDADAGDLSVLAGIRSALTPGGVLLIETIHRDAIAREFAERDWWEAPSGDTVFVEREFDPIAGVSYEILRWRDAEGNEGEKRHAIRIRAASEWAALLATAGFRPLEWYGDWSLEPFTLSSERLIVLCERT